MYSQFVAQNEHKNGMTNEGRDLIEPDGPSGVSKEDEDSKVST